MSPPMSTALRLPFEGKELTLQLPASWTVLAELSPNLAPGLADVPAAKSAPKHATVYVFPHGGVTYPVLEG